MSAMQVLAANKNRVSIEPGSTRSILNLGCGRKYIDGAVNLDVSTAVRADVLHDVDHRPWPLLANTFNEVLAFDVIEHCADVVSTMEEIHRVCRSGAVVKITVPHFSCSNSYTDPTHKHVFSLATFDYFTGKTEFSFYTPIRFSVLRKQLVFTPRLVNKLIWRLADRFPAAYESRWAWMFPAWFIYAELEVAK